MNLTKVARLFSKGNKTTKVDELLEDMPSFIAKEIQEPQGSSWITKSQAKEAKKNFEKERGDSQDPNDRLLLAELDDIILGNVKGIEPTEDILGKGWEQFAKGADKKAYPLRFAGDEVDREMFQRKYIGSYDNWAIQKEDQVSDWLSKTENGKRFQLETFGQLITPLGDTSLINKTAREGKETELEIMRKLKTENTSDVTLEDIDRYDFAEGGATASQMNSLMGNKETTTMPDGTPIPNDVPQEGMVPDEQMESDYVDFVVDQALSPEEQDYLNKELESNDTLSMLFDKVVEVASEFSGEGPVDGPGTGISDSIPARLSDGEFVFTADAVKVIGVEKLEELMEAAEAQYDERLTAYNGGVIRQEIEKVEAEQTAPAEQNINVTKSTLDNQQQVGRQEQDLAGKAIKENMMLDPYQQHVRS
tara:strand:- start:1008 stop:2267 length:1260 start_codon:yes stop_codon:yes gene_type:complete